MSLKRLIVGDATVSTMKKAGMLPALIGQDTANSSAKGMEKQPLKKGAIGK